ncbi:acyl-CoA N-acyltransferase [Schizophyllum fasciatum]
MPVTHVVVPSASESKLYYVTKNNLQQPAQVLKCQDGRAYVHYVRLDKRMDEWVPEESLRPMTDGQPYGDTTAREIHRRKRRRVSRDGDTASEASVHAGEDRTTPAPEIIMSEEEYDLQHHKRITQQKNFEFVCFRHWRIRTWYFSPYPLFDVDTSEIPMPTPAQPVHQPLRQHGRSSDLFAGTLGKYFSSGDTECVYVCDLCFKYFAEMAHLELHKRKCTMFHPPGRRVYQQGALSSYSWAHVAYAAQIYCQNLALFGKLFIDIKTVFFDLDNFFFYVTTDGETKQDNPVGYFSKEKVSYDDYNLACITVFPPYQRKAFGILMIEFRKIGSPERPLSDLGLRSYLAYWVAAIVRLLRQLLTVVTQKHVSYGMTFEIGTPEVDIRSPASSRPKKAKGWAGEVSSPAPQPESALDPIYVCRTLETTPNEDGSASTHAYVRCTLEDIARATHLRPEDAAFALHEMGLLDRYAHLATGPDAEQEFIVITRTTVEQVVRERDVKMEPCMKREHVML